MSIKFHIVDKWKPLLTENGFNNFEDFFKDFETLKTLTEERSASVSKLQLGENKLFLKRNYSERPRKVIRTYFKGKLYKQPAILEKCNLDYLSDKGFNLMKVAAWGEKRTLSWPVKAFLLVENVDGEEFIDFYKSAKFSKRIQLYREFGKLIGSLHSQSLDSIIRPQDIFCKSDGKDVNLTIIDREEGSTRKVIFDEKKILWELATMFIKGVLRYNGLYISGREGLEFCTSYLKENSSLKLSSRELFNKVCKEIIKYMEMKTYSRRVGEYLPESIFGSNLPQRIFKK